MNSWVTVQDAADYLGFSVSTFKRFCDTHHVPLARTPGGHRRIDRATLESTKQMLLNQHAVPSVQRLDSSELLKQLMDLLLHGKGFEIAELLWRLVREPSMLVPVLEETLVPTLWRVGDYWLSGELTTVHEKIASQTASQALELLACKLPFVPLVDSSVVGASFPPSSDTIASRMIALGLQSRGVSALNLGPNVSPEIIAEAADSFDSKVIWISHTHVDDVPATIANHLKLRSLLHSEVRVLIGGGGISQSMRRQLPDCIYYESIQLMIDSEFPSRHSAFPNRPHFAMDTDQPSIP